MKHCLRDQYVFYYECGCFWFSFHHRWRILHAFFLRCVFFLIFFTRYLGCVILFCIVHFASFRWCKVILMMSMVRIKLRKDSNECVCIFFVLFASVVFIASTNGYSVDACLLLRVVDMCAHFVTCIKFNVRCSEITMRPNVREKWY